VPAAELADSRGDQNNPAEVLQAQLDSTAVFTTVNCWLLSFRIFKISGFSTWQLSIACQLDKKAEKNHNLCLLYGG